MREYELTLILKSDLGDDGLTGATERIKGWIVGGGGEVTNVINAGRKRLAYTVSHVRDGSYVVMQFRSRPDALPEVERSLRLFDDVLRHMFIRR